MAGGKLPGSPKTGGRVAGTPNKKTLDLASKLDELGFDPVTKLVTIANFALKEYEQATKNNVKWDTCDHCDSKTKCEHDRASGAEWLRIAGTNTAELLPYLYPKRKAIEFKDGAGNPLNGTPVMLYIPANGRESNN